jgi:hypothetical protein
MRISTGNNFRVSEPTRDRWHGTLGLDIGMISVTTGALPNLPEPREIPYVSPTFLPQLIMKFLCTLS